MADNTPIEWADATVNAINGCTVLSPGCTNCYAMKLAGTRLKHHESRKGLTIDTKAGPVWNGTVRLHAPALLQPLSWKRPRVIFWNAHGDPFHPDVPDDWLWEMFEVIQRTRHHKHLVLTKRSARMREFVEKLTRLPSDINSFYGLGSEAKLYQPIRNLWLGVSVEDQARADERIPDLLATMAEGRFLSCEPLLGPIDLSRINSAADEECYDGEASRGRLNALTGAYYVECPEDDGSWVHCCGPDVIQRGFDPTARWEDNGPIHGVIVGGESGPGARPMHPEWVRQIRDDCALAGVDFHFKQWGAWVPLSNPGGGHWPTDTGGCIRLTADGRRADDGHPMQKVGKKHAGRTLDGVTHDALPWRRAA